ncbi:hypothetical protein [Nakamurella deserti]|uniref:hypothetical protein n=1 Tax=Nakamurella deserti TaxID=2164074 RepID=UPI0013007DDE|nr:hypothetical protein [Nakamurella deserti]
MLTGVTLLVMVWVAPGVPTGAVWAMVGGLAVTSLAGAGMLRRARQWQRLATVTATRTPALVEVIDVHLSRTGFVVDYRPIRGATLPHSFTIGRWFDLEPPVSGERLEVWSSAPDGGGPLLMRQHDGTWWAASGSLH